MNVPWYAYLAALLVGVLASIIATLARDMPFGLGTELRRDALIFDLAAETCLLNLMMLDMLGWLLR